MTDAQVITSHLAKRESGTEKETLGLALGIREFYQRNFYTN